MVAFGEYLDAHGWGVWTRARADMFAGAGLAVPVGDSLESLQNGVAVTAILP